MTNETFKDIEKLESDLWEAADNLRANSKLTSSDYFMPVLGVIFLRHAANRFEAATIQIREDQATGKMPKRKVLPADYLRRRALWLPENARYDWIMQQAATSGADLPKLVILDNLWAALPRPLFSDEETEEVANRVYEYVWQRSAGGHDLLAA